MKRRYKVILITLFIVIALSASVAGYFLKNHQKTKSTDFVKPAPKNKIIIQISGAVVYPDIYCIESDLRVIDVINLAGGLKTDADISKINLVKKLKDEMQIYIPYTSETLKVKINLNKASINELKKVPGIGEVLALEIVLYREKKLFKTLDELKSVKGISSKMYAKIKDYFIL